MLKFVLMGLLNAEPRYGYELKAVFEAFLGGTWPLNIGQVYTTLGRLEDEGLVVSELVTQESAPDRKVYGLTPSGRKALAEWSAEPERGPVRLRDEFFMKVAVLSLSDGPAAAQLVASQRSAHLETLAQLTQRQRDPDLHPATELLLEGAVLRVEADLKWLDEAESRMKELAV